jgi:UDPglucose 6-dehydrogenase
MIETKKITVVGCGYVGTSLGCLLAENHKVTFMDIEEERVKQINEFISPVPEKSIHANIIKNKKNISATSSKDIAYNGADLIVIATSTNYDDRLAGFDTSSVENVLHEIDEYNKDALVVIKSTVPVGFTSSMQKEFSNKDIIFSPEFLREGKTIEDHQNPSRIIVGSKSYKAKIFAQMVFEISVDKNVKILYTNSSEAEAIKLFSNTYLSMRVSFFNELDNFAFDRNLNAKEIIEGVSMDRRIRGLYNNPSFGYGGYCLPKDTQQLSSNFEDTPHKLINAIHISNETRKDFLVKKILINNPKVVGIYRLQMKKDSTNFREASIIGLIERLKNFDVNVQIYEPLLNVEKFMGFKVTKDIEFFKESSDVILANRYEQEILNVQEKIFTRDIFQSD